MTLYEANIPFDFEIKCSSAERSCVIAIFNSLSGLSEILISLNDFNAALNSLEPIFSITSSVAKINFDESLYALYAFRKASIDKI